MVRRNTHTHIESGSMDTHTHTHTHTQAPAPQKNHWASRANSRAFSASVTVEASASTDSFGVGARRLDPTGDCRKTFRVVDPFDITIANDATGDVATIFRNSIVHLFFSENRRDRRRIGLVTFDFFSVFIFLLEPSPCNGYHWSVRRKDGDKKNVLHSTWKGSVDRGRRPKSWARARFRQLRYMRYYGSLFEPYPNGKVLGRCKTAN